MSFAPGGSVYYKEILHHEQWLSAWLTQLQSAGSRVAHICSTLFFLLLGWQ